MNHGHVVLQTPAKASLADTLMAAAGRLSPFQDEADLRAAPEDLSSASDSGSQTQALHNGTQPFFNTLCPPSQDILCQAPPVKLKSNLHVLEVLG